MVLFSSMSTFQERAKKTNGKEIHVCIESRLDLQRSLLMQLVIYIHFELLTPVNIATGMGCIIWNISLAVAVFDLNANIA